jgi:hypothetical protein
MTVFRWGHDYPLTSGELSEYRRGFYDGHSERSQANWKKCSWYNAGYLNGCFVRVEAARAFAEQQAREHAINALSGV